MRTPIPAPTSAPTNYIGFKQLQLKGVPVSNQTLLRWERDGTFPKRIHLSPSVTIWIESEVDACILARRDAANTHTQKATQAHMAQRTADPEQWKADRAAARDAKRLQQKPVL